MHSIVSSAEEPALTLQFREWVESEWGDTDPFECSADGIIFPSPILAIEGIELLGGLSFTSHAKPDSSSEGVWINTLYVAPAFRNRGIGAKLVHAAELEARKLVIEELYIYRYTRTLSGT